MNKENAVALSAVDAMLSKGMIQMEDAHAEGHYNVECRDAEGNLKWNDEIENLVVNVGKNLALDTLFTGSAYTTVGPFMGLANSAVASATATDTMITKTTWLEVGTANAPAYTAPRKTVTFSAASVGAKASSGTYTFTFTSAGTVGGCFIVTGTGALSTIDNTAGVLYSVGAFTGGSKVVASSDTLTVTYSASM